MAPAISGPLRQNPPRFWFFLTGFQRVLQMLVPFLAVWLSRRRALAFCPDTKSPPVTVITTMGTTQT